MAENNEILPRSTFVMSGYAIENILKSGLILEEDFNAILMHYTSDDKYSPEVNFTIHQKLLSAISIAGSMFIIQHKYPISYLPLFGAPLVAVGFQHLRDALYRRRQKQDVKALVGSFSNTLKLLRMIFGYFRMKDSMNPELVEYVNSYSNPCRKLIDVVFSELRHFLSECINFVNNFALRVPSLSDYLYLESVELEQFDKSNVTCIQDCAIYLQKLCDVFVLVSSNTLTGLAIILCSNISTTHNINPCEVLDVVVPEMKNVSIDCYEHIKKVFNELKYYHSNMKIMKNAQKPMPTKQGGKLYIGSTNIMVHTSEIVEKSHQVLKYLEKGTLENLRDKQTVFPLIAGLRKQVNEYYECLDLFYKMLEVDINRPKLPRVLPGDSKPQVTEPSESSAVNEARFVDINLNSDEPQADEEYELYIGANDPPGAVAVCYEEADRQYAKMLGQELKAKLKNHSAFAAARQKRGIIDEEPKNNPVPEIEQIPPPPPPFAFGAVPKFSAPVAAPNWNDINAKSVAPPPPPPLGSFDLGPYGDIEPPPYSPFGNYLDIIKAISTCRQENEEVFEENDLEKK